MKFRIIAALMIVMFIFTACSENKMAGRQTPGNQVAPGTSGAELSPSGWTGTGGFYKLEEASALTGITNVTGYDGRLYCIIKSLTADNRVAYELLVDSDSVYRNEDKTVSGVAVSESGIWVAESYYSDGKRNDLILISQSGEIIRTVQLDSESYSNVIVLSLLWTSGNLYIVAGCPDASTRTLAYRLIALSEQGEPVCSIDLSEKSGHAALGSDGQVYIREETADGNNIYSVDLPTESLVYQFSTGKGEIYGGSNGSLLILDAGDGLYALDSSGAALPIVIWSECGIYLGDLISVIPLSGGGYFCLSGSGLPHILSPADYEETKIKTRLVIASIAPVSVFHLWDLQQKVVAFNSISQDYYVEIADFSSEGSLSSEQALTKLNTEIMSGNPPDMICFVGLLSPSAYISRGYLDNLSEYFESDNEISLDDIAIAKALETSGGIYYIGSEFVLETLVGLHSKFGDRYGWTLSEYLDIERSLSSEEWTLYNTTKEQFLRQISSRYIRTAIDWENGTCDFDNAEFIEILEASTRIRENPEDLNNMVFGTGSMLVTQGKLVAGATWVDSVWKLAYEESMVKHRLSTIGWPTANGSCGSDIYLQSPVGIVSQSPNGDGCWEFIKFILKDVETDASAGGFGMPVYSPLLNAMVENAKTNKDLPYNMTTSDAERLFALLSATENIAIYDETVLKIIEEESSAFFNNQRTAAQAASSIQSRVSIYVFEQAA